MAQRVGRGISLLFHDRDTVRRASGRQHAPAALYPRERPGTHCTGGWVGPRAGLDEQTISSPPGLDRPARSQSLYRLSYRAHIIIIIIIIESNFPTYCTGFLLNIARCEAFTTLLIESSSFVRIVKHLYVL